MFVEKHLLPADLSKYRVAADQIERSHVHDLTFWAVTTWDEVVAFDEFTTPEPDVEYVILFNKDSAPITPAVLFERTLNAPLNRVRFYADSNPLLLKDRPQLLKRSVNPVSTVDCAVKRAVYQLPELNNLQSDYVDRLFSKLWNMVFDEQQQQLESELYDETVTNQLIPRLVTEMSMETLGNDNYLVFTYEETADDADQFGTVPLVIDIEAVIPVDEDDELESGDEDDMGYDEEGNQGVLFDLILTRTQIWPVE